MTKRKGFTIIEVALVLAVAGLIFAMMFAVLPSLWTAERDSARRDHVLTFVDTLKNFQSNNNRGALPTLTGVQENSLKDGGYVEIRGEDVTPSNSFTDTSWFGFYSDYFGDSYVDPDGPKYNWIITNCGASTLDTTCTAKVLETLKNGTFAANDHRFYIVRSASCDGEDAILSANSRKVAVLYRLEGSGIYCANT